jgi:uncharacterized RDD family membrane protein YckC
MTETLNTFSARSLTIETPEGVAFSLPLAGPITRFLAWMVDTLVIAAASGLVYRLLYFLGAIDADFMAALTVLSGFVIWMGYGMLFEWIWHGQTIGKRALNLRVVDASGRRLEPSQIVMRNLMRAADSLPGLYLLGGAALLLTRNYQRLGDLVSNTVVIRRRQLALPELAAVAEGDKYNSFLEAPHLVARLRANTPSELAHVAYQALLRRNDLRPEVRIEILHEISERFREIVKFPDEITFALTDERYVRNAVAVLAAKSVPRRPMAAHPSERLDESFRLSTKEFTQ